MAFITNNIESEGYITGNSLTVNTANIASLTLSSVSAATLSATTINYINPLPNGEIYMVANTTPTPILLTTTYYKASGTTISGSLVGFSHPVSNRIQYTGTTTLTFMVLCNCSLSVIGVGRAIRTAIVKNGTGTSLVGGILANTEQNVFSSSTNLIMNSFAGGVITLNPNDYLELYIRNITITSNVIVDSMSFIIKQI